MDSRKTLGKNETFLDILMLCMKEKQKVNMLLDNNGLSRIDGLIKTISPPAEPSTVELEGGQKIEIRNIVAVNGIFSEPYSEC
jgi:hypothetical protein